MPAIGGARAAGLPVRRSWGRSARTGRRGRAARQGTSPRLRAFAYAVAALSRSAVVAARTASGSASHSRPPPTGLSCTYAPLCAVTTPTRPVPVSTAYAPTGGVTGAPPRAGPGS